MSLFGVLIGTAAALPIGIFLSRRPKLSGYAIDVAGIIMVFITTVLLDRIVGFIDNRVQKKFSLAD